MTLAETGGRGSLRDALAILNAARRALSGDAPDHRVGLACGFTPLHLQTLLHAQLQQRYPDARVEIATGDYGALAEAAALLAAANLRGCAVVVEWADLDPRLGWRESINAPLTTPDDILATARARLARLRDRIARVAASCPTALALPALDLAPAYAAPPGVCTPLVAALRALVAEFAAELGSYERLRLVETPRLPAADLQAASRSGFPYTVGYSAALALRLSSALAPVQPKKGLITDLDDTLWRGLVGEVGADAVRWDLDSGAHLHALYQQQLQALAERGVLLAAVSKNDAAPVAEALARADLLLDPQRVFPVAASWEPKSRGVAEVLAAWNIAPADVVLIDDNPMELAEVQAAFPELEVLQFPTADPDALATLLETLRDRFPPEPRSAEDALRLASVRSGAALRAAAAEGDDQVGFLRDLQGRLVIDVADGWQQPRALELINKTNQFTINGARLDETTWRAAGTAPGGVACTVAYTDRFGPLGVVSVLGGRLRADVLEIDTWVLSCRAFSRAIEHHLLAALLDRFDVAAARLRYVRTERNDVAARFLAAVGTADGDAVIVDREALKRSASIGIHATEFGGHAR